MKYFEALKGSALKERQRESRFMLLTQNSGKLGIKKMVTWHVTMITHEGGRVEHVQV